MIDNGSHLEGSCFGLSHERSRRRGSEMGSRSKGKSMGLMREGSDVEESGHDAVLSRKLGFWLDGMWCLT